MIDIRKPDASSPRSQGFPFGMALATGAGLLLFLGLVYVVYQLPNYLGENITEPKVEPIEKLDEIRSRNKVVLEGTDTTVKMSSDQATAALLDHVAKSKDAEAPYGRLPFPMEPKKP